MSENKTFEGFKQLAEYKAIVIDGTGEYAAASRDELADRAAKALELIVRFGGIDGAHHKAWVLDQVTRVLAGEGYGELVREAKDGVDGPETYLWNEGIPP